MKTAFLRDEMTIESSQSIYFVPSTSRRAGPSGALVFREQDFAADARRRRQPGGHRYRTRESRETTRQSEAERQGERLKSALLDSVTHDFRTPLTSMKAAVTNLLASGNCRSADSRIADHLSNRRCVESSRVSRQREIGIWQLFACQRRFEDGSAIP